MMRNILNYIDKYRRSKNNILFLKNFCILISISLLSFICLSFIEEIFYLTPYNRKNYIILLLSIFIACILFLITRWIINYFRLLSNNSDEKNAHIIGEKIPEIKDQLLNTIQ